jgi:hypothetical protein
MNLLNDQWEKQQAASSGDSLKSSPVYQLVGEEPLAGVQDFTFPDPQQDFEQGSKKGKRIALSFILIFIFLAVAAAGLYFGYFNKELPKLPFGNLFTKSEAKIDTAITQAPIAVQPESTTVRTEAEIPTPAETPSENVVEESQPAIALCAMNLDKLLGAQPQDVRIATLILDETSFSVEVLSRNRQSAETFYQGLKNQMSGEIAFSAAAGTAETARALISGTFSSSSSPSVIDKSAMLTRDQLRSHLSQASGKTGAKIMELSIGETMLSSGVAKAPVFVKVSGLQSQCQAFFGQMAQEGKNLRVAKIILMAGNPQQASLVARLELLQPA